MLGCSRGSTIASQVFALFSPRKAALGCHIGDILIDQQRILKVMFCEKPDIRTGVKNCEECHLTCVIGVGMGVHETSDHGPAVHKLSWS